MSALTGFPAVLGSVPVQNQQRPGMERLVAWRSTDIATVYGSIEDFASVEPILQDYGVQVIYVGPLERVTYGQSSLAKFEEAADNDAIEVLYDDRGCDDLCLQWRTAFARAVAGRTVRSRLGSMQLDRIVIQVEVAARRWLPAGLVFLANARLHRWKGEAELGELPRLVTPGTVAIDVGAHFGTYSHALSRLVGKSGKVISVEPIAEDAAFIRAAARQLRLPIEVQACALSATAGEATLRIPARYGKQKTALATLEDHQGEGRRGRCRFAGWTTCSMASADR